MSKLLLTILVGSLFFSACRKESFTPTNTVLPCEMQTANPSGRSYSAESVVDFVCKDKHCGLLPLHVNNYWVYEDSIYINGIFNRVQLDTLRYNSTMKTMSDGLIWWESNAVSVGLPALLYANDSSFFTLNNRLFTPDMKDAKKDYSVPAGDSLRYLTSFEDAAANGRTLKLQNTMKIPAGSFSNCLYFEKTAKFLRRDQLYYQPGLGVLKYIQEKGQVGNLNWKMAQVSTLISYHIE